MHIEISKLEKNCIGIYKINFPNGKIYIGQSNNIKRRMFEHNNLNKINTVCDYAIAKYGKIKDIEILERLDSVDELDEKEKFWIHYYKSNKRDIGYNVSRGGGIEHGENSPTAVFTNEQVYDIRLRKYENQRKKEVYTKYYSSYKFTTFENVWLGKGYPDVGADLKKTYNPDIYAGEHNGISKLTKIDVINIRERYANGEMQKDIKKDYPHVGKTALNNVCRNITWKNV